MSDLDPLRTLLTALWARLGTLQHEQRGYSSEAVVVTAALVALALAVTAIIAYKVVQQANNIATK